MSTEDRVMWGVCAVIILVAALLLLLGPSRAACEASACYGGMCMDSAACAPGCHCLGGRCG